MPKTLLRSKAFIRAAKQKTARNKDAVKQLCQALDMLRSDPYDPRLKTHKLKGELAGHLACSAGYDLRIIFRFVPHADGEAVLLEAVGTHDEVY